MMQEDLFIGMAKPEDYEAYIDFANYVFGMNGADQSFYKLLPKLFTPEGFPQDATYVVKEKGEFRASIGAYPMTVHAGETALSVCGIGNVSVHPRGRSKGYMKELMNRSLDDMIAHKVDFAVLSGLRNRYQYFSYETCGEEVKFEVTKTSLRHQLAADITDGAQIQPMKAEDTQTIRLAKELYAQDAMYVERPLFWETLCSWEAEPFAVTRGEEFLGYFNLQRADCFVPEFRAVSAEAADVMLALIVRTMGMDAVSFLFAPYDTLYMELFYQRCEKVVHEEASNYSVLNYCRVLEAMLKLKGKMGALSDGELNMLIHGAAGDEQLKITVKGSTVCVQPTKETPQVECGHLEAMRFFFKAFDVRRQTLDAACAGWFPLPLYHGVNDRT